MTTLAYYIPVIFYQRSVTHLLLTDCDQQNHFQYFTHGLRVSEILFYRLHFSVFSRPISVLFYWYLCMNVIIVCLIQRLAAKTSVNLYEISSFLHTCLIVCSPVILCLSL